MAVALSLNGRRRRTRQEGGRTDSLAGELSALLLFLLGKRQQEKAEKDTK